MAAIPAAEVRAFVVQALEPKLRQVGIEPAQAPDDLDLIERDLVDSLGLLELIADVEHRFGFELDFENVDPEDLTVLGELCRRVAEQSVRAA
jgi:acyl carrier protein